MNIPVCTHLDHFLNYKGRDLEGETYASRDFLGFQHKDKVQL
jgi:hypothetical protein